MTTPSFIVYFSWKGVDMGLDVMFYPGRSKGQPERPVKVSSDRWEGDIGKLGKAEIKKRIETSILKSETVSREYPVLAWDGGFYHVLDEDAKWRNAVKWKGWRV